MQSAVRVSRDIGLVLALLAGSVSMALAGPETAGTAVNPLQGAAPEINIVIKSDGADGAFVAFKHPQSSPTTRDAAIGVFRLTSAGVPDPSWAPLFTTPTPIYSREENAPKVFLAEPGATWLVTDRQDSNYQAFVLKRQAEGFVAPSLQTVNVDSPSLWTPSYVVEGGGGAVWFLSSSLSIRMAPDGSVQSFPANVVVPVFGIFVSGPGAAVADGAGGAYVIPSSTSNVGVTENTQGLDLVLYRVDSQGSVPWTGPSYRVVSTAVRDQFAPSLIADAAHGATVAWVDRRTIANGADIYITRITPEGVTAPGWQAGGRAVAAVPSEQVEPVITSDGSGGVWVVWRDTRSAPSRIYVQHILQNGAIAPGFPTGGRALAPGVGDQVTPRLASDGAGGFFALWIDHRNGNADLYGVHCDAAGQVLPGLEVSGQAICTEPSTQADPVLLSNAPGQAIAAWRDFRNGVSEKVYAVSLTAAGGVLDAPRPGGTPVRLSVLQNPARSGLALRCSAPAGTLVEIDLLDVSGRVVRSGQSSAGGTVRFNGLGSGLYFARARAGQAEVVERVAVVR